MVRWRSIDAGMLAQQSINNTKNITLTRMTLSIDARKGSTMAMAMPRDDIEISNFRNYVLKIEGEKKVSKNSQDKKLNIKVGTDGVLYIDLISSGTAPVEDFSFIDASVPAGYRLYKTTSASKAIRGVKGKYRIYINDNADFLAFAIGPSGKAYRINLGNLSDGDSKLHKVLDAVPEGSFHKAYFNNQLPSVIVENRQPIKAALDVLEEEGYVKKTGRSVGVSEEYVKTAKKKPSIRYYSSEENNP